MKIKITLVVIIFGTTMITAQVGNVGINTKPHPSVVLDIYSNPNHPGGLGIPVADPQSIENPREGNLVFWKRGFPLECVLHYFNEGIWWDICGTQEDVTTWYSTEDHLLCPPAGTVVTVQPFPEWNNGMRYAIQLMYDTVAPSEFMQRVILFMNYIAARSHPELLIPYSELDQKNFTVDRWADIARLDSFGFRPISFALFFQKILQDFGMESFLATLGDVSNRVTYPVVIVNINNRYYFCDVAGRVTFARQNGALMPLDSVIMSVRGIISDSIIIPRLRDSQKGIFLSVDSCVFFQETAYERGLDTVEVAVTRANTGLNFRQVTTIITWNYLLEMAPMFHRIVYQGNNPYEIAKQLPLHIININNGTFGSSGTTLKLLIDSWVQ